MNTLQKNALYFLRFNGCYYQARYVCDTMLGYCFKSGRDTIYCGELRLSEENPVLWKVKK